MQAEDSSVWSQADQRPHALDLFESDLAAAIAAAWSDVESAFIIASVPVTGGSSPPGGPLTGGTATLAPGMLVNTASFTAIAGKFSSSFPDGATEGLLALVDAVAQGIGLKFPLWAAGYSAVLTASGGTCAWVAGPPPAPGPWTGGSIQDFALSGGSSTGDQGMTAASLAAAIGSAADPSKLKQHQNTLQPALSALIQAVAKGFAATWNDWKTKTKISGGTGTGMASPGGAVIGAVASPQVR